MSTESLFPAEGPKRSSTASSAITAKPVNVSKVKQFSPFRYPGGKTWLVPEIVHWMRSLDFRPRVFVEPFAGGGIASLTVAIEDLADQVIMNELDPDIASVWHTILEEPDELCERIGDFDVTHKNVRRLLAAEPQSVRERAFQTIVKNRTQRGGIIAPGASLVKLGENGKGLRSRWYPATLIKRIKLIHEHRKKIAFFADDGFEIIQRYSGEASAVFFVDPPYTAGGKRAGKRLYRYNEVDHMVLYRTMAAVAGQFLMTFDDSKEVRFLADRHGFAVREIPMKNTHHSVVNELLITNMMPENKRHLAYCTLDQQDGMGKEPC